MPQLDGAVSAGSDGTSKYQQQLDFLTNRHQQFKKAALTAKTAGDKEKAMSYLRSMKGMEKMIESAKSGRPIDIRQLPPAPESTPGKSFGNIFFSVSFETVFKMKVASITQKS